MSTKTTKPVTRLHGETATAKGYIVGFILSVALTLAAYLLVVRHVDSNHQSISHQNITIAVIIFAFIQLFVQLVFFLHLSREPKPQLNVKALWFTVLIVAILVIGTLWIMTNLDYAHQELMTPEETKTFIQDEEAIYN
jgi:cytochrome o ubiquinol oxidase subunit IV